MFAHNLHEMDVTKPPPAIDDSFPHPTLLEQLRITDEQIVHRFLSKFVAETVPECSKRLQSSSDSLGISSYRHELDEALQIIENLKHSKNVLEELSKVKDDTDSKWHSKNALDELSKVKDDTDSKWHSKNALDELSKVKDDTDSKWQNELERTEHLKGRVLSLLTSLEDAARKKKLSRKLALRRKKRAWQKRRNERLKTQRIADQAGRQQRLHEITTWENEWKAKLEQERIARIELQTKTVVLNDVRCRKARAKRLLNRFEKALLLCQQRHTAKATPTTVESQTVERFEKKIYSLIAEWKGKLGECVREEKHLKDELNRQSAGNEGRRRENRWRKVLFGTAAASGGQMAGNRSREDLITVRWAWDQFTVPYDKEDTADSGRASVAPATWVKAPEQPQPDWAIYREPKKTKTRKLTAVQQL